MSGRTEKPSWSAVRDPETANAALLAASTGHSVFATIHADSAPDAYPGTGMVDPRYERLVPQTLRGIFWQHMLRFSDGQRAPLPIYESIKVTGAVRQILVVRLHLLWRADEAPRAAEHGGNSHGVGNSQ